ncbi:hypothetical protein [Actinacidiphila sp. bgisy167]|uniref:hypothetical protein n=1 Tax=Actinacidiphila sp. bgisy167 TaxID=3413797 RepID=UPI003D726491
MSDSSDTRTGARPGTLVSLGLVCAVAGFFVLGIVLGPVAVVCGRRAMNRTRRGAKPVLPLVAVVLGALDTLIAVLWIAGDHWTGSGLV